MTQAIEQILERLQKVKKQGKGYMACCPAHLDKSPSLSVMEADNGKVLVHCFAGCKTADVMAAIGLELRDLFTENMTDADRLAHQIARLKHREDELQVIASIAAANMDTLTPEDVVKSIEYAMELERVRAALLALGEDDIEEEDDCLEGQQMARDAKAPVYLIDQVLEEDSHGIMGGASMTYKSFLALRMAYAIATNSPFFGHKVFRSGPVLLVCGEGKGGISRRWRALCRKFGDAPQGSFYLYNRSVSIKGGVSMTKLANTIEKIKPVLVIFDTFSSLSGGVEENSATEVALALKHIREVCKGSSSLLVHHYGKTAAQGFRGASNFLNDTDFAYECTRPEGSTTSTLKCLKTKDGEPFSSIDFTGVVVPLGLFDQNGKEVTSLVAEPDLSNFTIPDKEYASVRG